MKDNLTDINVVLDRSGSMSSVRTDTIGGFNTFLKAQKEAVGEANFTLAQFDHEYEIVHNGVGIQTVPELTAETFVPRGNTALLDAIGRTINETGARLSKLPDDERPAKVIFVILTDGAENASHEFTKQQINEMITKQREVYKWDFVFLGANQDAIAVGTGFGVAAGSTMTYAANTMGTQSVYSSLARNVASYRSGGMQGQSIFTDEDRQEQTKAGAKK
jgi:hypothetical protein